MKDGQQKIYYATGKDKEAIEGLPQMELLRDRDIEVLYMTDPVDEFAVEAIGEYEAIASIPSAAAISTSKTTPLRPKRRRTKTWPKTMKASSLT